MAELILDLIISVLYFILVAGVIYVIKEFLKHLIDKKLLEKDLEDIEFEFANFKKNTQDKLSEYETSISALQLQFKKYSIETENVLKQSNNDVEQILSVAKNILNLHENLCFKIMTLDQCLKEDPSSLKSEMQALVSVIEDDIEKELELGQRIEQYKQELSNSIHQRLLKKKTFDMDMEI